MDDKCKFLDINYGMCDGQPGNGCAPCKEISAKNCYYKQCQILRKENIKLRELIKNIIDIKMKEQDNE